MKIYQVILGFVGVTLLSPVAIAQSGVLEEVVVTAQRREQSLQDVPIAVTAFTGTALERSNIKSAVDYLSLTPNVSFTEDGQSGSRGLGLAIRGINNLVTGENAFTNSIGMYMDEFSIGSVPNGVANPFLPDMQRVEVLRGPQGTYFGRNSLGGALNLTTNDPTEEFGMRLILGGEGYDGANEMFNGTAIINAPVSDDFGIRGVVYYEDSGGLVDNICAAGQSDPVDCPDPTTTTGTPDSGHEWLDVRLKAVWDVSDRTTVKGTFLYSDLDQGTDENVPSGIIDLDSADTFGLTGAVPTNAGVWPQNRNKLSHDQPETNELETVIGILNIAHDISDDLTVKWISGFIDAEQVRLFDNDLLGGADIVRRDNLYEGFSWSTELRAEYLVDNYDLVVGAMYAEDEQEQANTIAIVPAGFNAVDNTKEYTLESVAVFGDFTYRFTETFDAFFGLRYTNDDVENFVDNLNFANAGHRASTDYDDLSGRVGATYKPSEEWTFYGTISKGYKNGGSSIGVVDLDSGGTISADERFDVGFAEEELWNYEIGAKASLLDNSLRLSASVFYLEWNDMQMESFRFLVPGDLGSNFEQTITLDKADAIGFEGEFLWAVTDQFTVSGALGIIDTEIKDAPLAEITGGYIVNLEGLDIPKAPELTANLTGEYRWPVGMNEAWVRLEYIHRDGQYSDIEGLTNQQTLGLSPNSGLSRPVGPGEFPYLSPDYDLVNLRAGFEMGQWSINAYVQNLLDEEYYTGTQENFGMTGIRLRPHPRVFGGSISYSFGDM
jgi:iron complex outermembrane receptor protein